MVDLGANGARKSREKLLLDHSPSRVPSTSSASTPSRR
jgi:hypothetical protein